MNESFRSALKTHRRARSLSQLALASDAGLSQKHVSFLETGRSKPGRTTVLRLANALALSHIEKDRLLEAAGFAGDYHPDIGGDKSLAAARQAIGRLLDAQGPFPGALVNARQDVIDTNAAFEKLIAMAGRDACLWERTCGEGPKNLLRLALHKEGLFPLMTEPQVLVPAFLHRVQREARGDETARQLIDEVTSWLHIGTLMTAAPPPSSHEAVVEERYRIGAGEIGLICLIVLVGAPNAAPAEGLRLELFHPADAESEAALRAINEGREPAP